MNDCMHRVFPCLFGLLWLGGCGSASSDDASARQSAKGHFRFEEDCATPPGTGPGKVSHGSFVSRHMGNKDWGFNIYLPSGYGTGCKRYPVVYSLHGGGSNEHGMTFTASNYVHRFMLDGKLPEFIMVFPSAGPDTFYLDNGVVRSQTNNPDAYIVSELIPHIDTNFRTIASPQGRTVTGFSMGGYGAYHFAFKYPELFSAAAPCAAGGPYGPNGLITNYSAADKPHALAVSNAAKLQTGMRVRVTVGGNDLVPYNNELVAIIKSQGIPHEYEILPGVGHDIGAIMNQSGLTIFQYITARFGAPETPTQRPLPSSVLRVEAGAASPYTDTDGQVWDADQGFVGGQAIDRGDVPVANTRDGRIYKTERYGMTRYALPAANGLWDVRLHFAETYAGITGPGQRVFDVDVEGIVLANLDVFREAGGRNIALMKTVSVTVSDGEITVGFSPRKDNAMINGIELIPR